VATQTIKALDPGEAPTATDRRNGYAAGAVAAAGRGLQRNAVALALLAGFVIWAVVASHEHYQYLASLVVAGLGTGAVAALSGVGLVLTYRATGVFNFAQGGVATVVAYVYYELNGRNDVPVTAAAIIAVVIAAPALGLIFEGVVFRPLERRGASTSEKLVANIGVLVLLLAGCTLIFTQQTFQPADVWPAGTAFSLGQVNVPWDTVGDIVLVAAMAVGLTVLFRATRLGTQIRAVVDRRTLAELNAVNANRVSQVAWVLGCAFAGIAGVLYAPQRGLQPGYLTLTVLETIGVAVVARLRGIPTAVVAGLAIGVVSSLGGAFSSYPQWVSTTFTELFVVTTVVFLLIYRNLDEIGAVGSTAALVTGRFGARARSGSLPVAGLGVAALAVLAPAVLTGDNLQTLQKVLAYSVAFLAVVAITGFSGHISLATATFAGLGAYASARMENGYLPLPTSWQALPHLTPLLALLVAALLVVPLGLLVGYPALRRKGLILALLTLASAQVIDKLIFQQPSWTNRGMTPRRPSLGPLELSGDRAFTWYELGVLGLALLLARNLRSGTLGRALGAMRDSENGAVSVGISLRRYKLVIFGASAFLAALGGGLIAQQARAVNLAQDGTFNPLFGLFWFTAVVVGGLSYLSGGIVAAVLFVGIDKLAGHDQVGFFVIGLCAVFIGYLPGGLVGTVSRLTRGGILRQSFQRFLDTEQARAGAPPPGTGLRPTAYARQQIGSRR
jgi:branched-chain amino acid transport system permease protein